MTDQASIQNSRGSLPVSADTARRRRAFRELFDRMFRYAMGVGGISVIVAIVLIFFYLLYEVIPLFQSASVTPLANYRIVDPQAGATRGLVLDEQMDVGVRYTSTGKVVFFRPADGSLISTESLGIGPGVQVSAFAQGEKTTGVVALGLDDGRVLIVRHRFVFSFPNNIRTITPKLEFVFEPEPLAVFENGDPVEKLVVQAGEEGTSIAAWSSRQPIRIIKFREEESFLDETVTINRLDGSLDSPVIQVAFMVMDRYQRELNVASRDGRLFRYDVENPDDIVLQERVQLLEPGLELTQITFLNGDISLLVGDTGGNIAQWFTVRDSDGADKLRRIRSFSLGKDAIASIIPEYNRKGFVAVDDAGKTGIFHTTAERQLLHYQMNGLPAAVAIAPRADGLIYQNRSGETSLWEIHNEHPEISWSSLWGKVWYESYPEPAYVWQSSAADNVFEPKFSLVPLAFGTIKAAFYAMLVAMPIAIFGAIYTAYFMSPRLRQLVKPTVEIMEALPTVILGFLAGLWLAPLVEEYLAGVFSLLLIVPVGGLVFAYLWQSLPQQLRHRVPDGWEPVILIPAVLFLGWLSFSINPLLENLFFAGDMKNWLVNTAGIGFDQRNSIVVGMAMGFAVIPTIFSITEDAVFSVPKQLTVGSLALGATPWQTMTRVVILTASPGIFSAVMIGLGRAVGETMIVLMATGNTPIMDFSIFEGMRTLAANIAVEMPESEVDSTHFRVLFLAALVLFGFTFIMNTAAEMIRHRLRKKYSSL